MWKAQGGFQDPPPTELAMPQDDRSFYAQTLLMLRQNYNVLSSGIDQTSSDHCRGWHCSTAWSR